MYIERERERERERKALFGQSESALRLDLAMSRRPGFQIQVYLLPAVLFYLVSWAIGIVLEAPIPKRSLGDKTSLYVIYIYIYIYVFIHSDKHKLKALLKRSCFLTKPLVLGIGASKVLPR